MPHARRGIAAAGNWIIDHIFIVDRWPQEETLANILDEDRGTGGAPYNVLVDLARFGPGENGNPIPLEAVGLIGDDADGAFIRQDGAAHGIDLSALGTSDEAPTSYTNVMVVQNTGRRTFFHNRGANARFGPEHVPVDALGARIAHLGYLLLLDRMDEPDEEYGTAAARVLARLQEAGIRTSIDVVSEDSDRFPKIVKPALAHADYAILNELEAGRTTGHDLKPGDRPDPEAIQASAADLLALGVRELVCIHMPEGAYVRTADGQEVWQPALRLPNGYVKGAAGAGDAFCAGLLYGLHEDWPLQDGLRLGVCAAAMSLSRPGCTEACTTVSDTLVLAGTYPYQKAVL